MVDVLCERLDFVPVLRDDGRVVAFIGRDEFGDVVDFGVVADAGLDLARCEGLVAIVPAVLEVGAVFDFLVGG